MEKNYMLLLMVGIIIIIISGCATTQQLSGDDKTGEKQVSTDVKVSSVQTNKKEITSVKPSVSPPEQLVFSEEIKEFTSEYCGAVLEDAKIEITSVKKVDEYLTADEGNVQIKPFQSSTTEQKTVTKIDVNLVKNIIKKMPIANLDSSITLGIVTRTDVGFKNYYTYVSSGEPIVKEQSFDFENTKIVLTIPQNTMPILGETPSNNICSKFKTEINNENVGYDVHFGITDSFKSGVSELKNCLQ